MIEADDICVALEAVIRLMVTQPAAVRLTIAQGNESLSLQVCVSPKDLGKVIGRGGRSANALRALLQAIGREHDVKLKLNIESNPDEEAPAIAATSAPPC